LAIWKIVLQICKKKPPDLVCGLAVVRTFLLRFYNAMLKQLKTPDQGSGDDANGEVSVEQHS
jgi:hypothetical protein